MQPLSLPSRLSVATILVLVAACGGASEPLPPAKGPGIAKIEEEKERSTNNFLVWTWPEDGSPETVWLSSENEKIRVLARRPELVISIPSRLWAWRTRAVELACIPDEERCACDLGHDVDAGFHDLLSHQAIDTGERAKEPLEAIREYDHRFSVDGSIGPYAFLNEETHDMGCGAAHSNMVRETPIIDLTTGKKSTVLTDNELQRVEKELAEKALAALGRGHEDDEMFDKKVAWTRFLPQYDDQGALVAEHQFTTGSARIYSDFTVGDYSRSTRIASTWLPAALKRFSLLPPAVISVRREAKKGKFGWSSVVLTPSERKDALAAFEAPIEVQEPRVISAPPESFPEPDDTSALHQLVTPAPKSAVKKATQRQPTKPKSPQQKSPTPLPTPKQPRVFTSNCVADTCYEVNLIVMPEVTDGSLGNIGSHPTKVVFQKRKGQEVVGTREWEPRHKNPLVGLVPLFESGMGLITDGKNVYWIAEFQANLTRSPFTLLNRHVAIYRASVSDFSSGPTSHARYLLMLRIENDITGIYNLRLIDDTLVFEVSDKEFSMPATGGKPKLLAAGKP